MATQQQFVSYSKFELFGQCLILLCVVMAAKVIANMYLSKAIGKNPFSAVFYEFNLFMHDGIVCSGKCMPHINNVLLIT